MIRLLEVTLSINDSEPVKMTANDSRELIIFLERLLELGRHTPTERYHSTFLYPPFNSAIKKGDHDGNKIR